MDISFLRDSRYKAKKGLVGLLTCLSLLSFSCKEQENIPTNPIQPPTSQNSSPRFNSSPITSVDENSYYTYYISTTDPDGDPVAYSLVQNPSWLSVSNNVVFGIPPEVSSNQTFPVRIKASDGKGGEAEQAYNLTVRNVSNTHVLNSSQTGSLTSVDSTRMVFSQPMNFAIGDFIASGITSQTPNGVLREISSVSSDKKTFYTSQATLEQIVRDASFLYSGRLLPPSSAKFMEGIQPLYPRGGQNFDFNLALTNVVLYDQDGNPNTTHDRVIANGNISFGINTILNLRINNHTLNELTFRNLTDIETDVTVGSNILGVAQLKQVKIAEYNFQPFVAGYLPTPVPIPIVILPKMGVYVGINPTNVNPFSVRVKQNANSEVGLIYNGVWNTTSNFSNSFDFSNPVINNNLELKVYTGPSLEFMLYGVAGPFGSLSGRLRLKHQNNSWELYGGFGAALGVKMEVFKKGISAQFREIINYEKLLAQSSISTLPGKILFVSGPEFIITTDDYPQIYTIKDDGLEFKQLTNFPYTNFSDFQPSGFPKENKITFVSNKDGNLEIYVLNLDNSITSRLTDNQGFRSNEDYSPNVSPNGQEIVFISNRSQQIQNKSSEIYLMNSDGTNQRKLNILSSILQHGAPRWSPDGQRIAFDATETGSVYNIYAINKNGSGLVKLTNNSSLNITAAWSSDGNKIAFASTKDGNHEIYVMNSDGSSQTRLTNNSAIDAEPSWLPDGRIVFISSRDGGYNQLHIMNSNGSGVRKITTKDYYFDRTPSYFLSQ